MQLKPIFIFTDGIITPKLISEIWTSGNKQKLRDNLARDTRPTSKEMSGKVFIHYFSRNFCFHFHHQSQIKKWLHEQWRRCVCVCGREGVSTNRAPAWGPKLSTRVNWFLKTWKCNVGGGGPCFISWCCSALVSLIIWSSHPCLRLH